jgi:large subunit ribosomal protein L22
MEAVAKLNNYPTSPRKMRLLADLIRGMEVDKALGILQFNPKHPAVPLYKLLKSAINNWEQKNTDAKVEDANLVVKTIMVDGGRVIRRMRPAPQGRGYRIRKRSNHVTLVVDTKVVKPGKEKVVLDRKEEPEAAAVAPIAKKTRTRTKKESTTTQTETK